MTFSRPAGQDDRGRLVSCGSWPAYNVMRWASRVALLYVGFDLASDDAEVLSVRLLSRVLVTLQNS